jgi:hypothetical protein
MATQIVGTNITLVDTPSSGGNTGTSRKSRQPPGVS